MHQRRRKLGALLVAMRELFHLRLAALREPEALEPPACSRPRRVCIEPVQLAEVLELLAHAHPRVQPALLGHVAELQPLLQPHRPPTPQHLATIYLDEAEDCPHRGRLPRPVGAEEAEHPPRLDREREIGEGLHGLEPFAHVDEAETVLVPWAARREREVIPRPNAITLFKLSLAEHLGRQQNQLLT